MAMKLILVQGMMWCNWSSSGNITFQGQTFSMVYFPQSNEINVMLHFTR